MRKSLPTKTARLSSFSLIELLVVILIIVILAGLTLAAGEGVMTSAARSRAKSEIQAIGAGLDAYKVDNGVYPWTNGLNTPSYSPVFNTPADFTASDGSTPAGTYQVSGQILYEALAGKTNFTDTPVAGVKTYINFKASQLGNVSAANADSGYNSSSSTYVQDPFGYSYGYYANAAAAAPPTNGPGLYDLWSTGGTLSSTANWQNTWISNWNGQ
jgi:type II secretory pathway pseudopilin PulG